MSEEEWSESSGGEGREVLAGWKNELFFPLFFLVAADK